MKGFIKISALAAALAATALSCSKADIAEERANCTGGERWIDLRFGAERSIEVDTKATVSERNESQIYNFFIFVFDRNGAKVTGKYFDTSNQKSDESSVKASLNNCWYVRNAANDTDTTEGTVRIQTAGGNGMRIYMIANLDSDMVRVSSDLLSSNIHNENDLLDFNVYLNQNIVNRNGYFPMTGRISDVSINQRSAEGKEAEVTEINAVMSLRRIDAKVRFIFKTGTRPDENGQTISKFEARQWKVVNVPRTAYLMGYDDRGIKETSGHDFVSVTPTAAVSEYSDYAKDFFDTDFVNFEDFPVSGQAEFSFYMLENRQKPKKSLTAFQDRSRSLKLPDGTNGKTHVTYSLNGVPCSRDMRLYEYANDFSTYVVVSGRVEMDLKNDSAGQVLGGDVQYIIHLGNWNSAIENSDGIRGDGSDKYSGFDNFNTERNTSYTYTVTVNSVHNIRVEVETSKGDVSDVKENQPGASGAITIAKEEIMLCDCHYVSKSVDFKLCNFFSGGRIDKDHCIVDELTWSVKTPFGEGEPVRADDGMDITTGLDYKWVHFRLNKKDADGNYTDIKRKYTDRQFKTMNEWQDGSDNAEGDGSEGLAGYHNDGIMDITELVQYMKKQVKRYIDSPQASEFDNLASPEKSKISFTVFVDEYYYESNPLNDEKSADLWKYFVNQEDRKLHILCSSEVSKDLESRATGSVITVQQHAIKSIYNTSTSYSGLQTAWGVETTDEYGGKWSYWSSTANERRGNTSESNGMLNTAREWGLCDAYSVSFKTGNSWNTYMNPEVTDDVAPLKDAYAYLRYSCMTRNRDNNGDGKIDRNEMRWYMASIRQLIGMYAGDGLLSSETKLYNRSPEDKNSDDQTIWRQHVISSFASHSNSNSNDPTMVWAEEGVSTSTTNPDWQPIKKATVRCVRNLGFVDGSSDETYGLDKEPQDYILMEKTSGDNYLFTTTHLNGQALRYYTSRELTYADERSVENRLYKRFEVLKDPVALKDENGNTLNLLFPAYNDRITESIASGKGNPFCPEGYRAPNQLEIAIIRYYISEDGLQNTPCRTYWSFGELGKYNKHQSDSRGYNYGFVVSERNLTVNNVSMSQTRCVRDIRVN